MNVNDIHPEIQKFIGDCSEDNYRYRRIGSIQALIFKNPKILVYSWTTKEGQLKHSVKYNGKRYSEQDFVRLLQLKAFW